MFEEKIATKTINEVQVDIWLNPPYGKMQELVTAGNNLAFLCYMVKRWNIGGQSYNGYEFPETPTPEALKQLPMDILSAIDKAVGEVVSYWLPKQNGTSSPGSTTSKNTAAKN